jgi:hypothetical protein
MPESVYVETVPPETIAGDDGSPPETFFQTPESLA